MLVSSRSDLGEGLRMSSREFPLWLVVAGLCLLVVTLACTDRRRNDKFNAGTVELSGDATGDQVVPPVETPAMGRAEAKVSDDNDGGKAEFTLSAANAEAVTSVTLHVGEEGENGEQIAALFSDQDGVTVDGDKLKKIGDATLTSADLAPDPSIGFDGSIAGLTQLMLEGKTYALFRTPANPDGLVRAQLYISKLNAEADPMTGDQVEPPVVTPATGDVSFQLNKDDNKVVEYEVVVRNINGVTAVNLTLGGIGENSATLVPLFEDPDGVSVGAGRQTIAEGTIGEDDIVPQPGAGLEGFNDLLLFMGAGGLSVSVHTLDHPGGEIGAPIVVENLTFDVTLVFEPPDPPVDPDASGKVELSEKRKKREISFNLEGLEPGGAYVAELVSLAGATHMLLAESAGNNGKLKEKLTFQDGDPLPFGLTTFAQLGGFVVRITDENGDIVLVRELGDCDLGVLGPNTLDLDGDGVTPCEGDCDDGNGAVNSDAVEVVDGVDNDCDGLVDNVDTGTDSDGDGVPDSSDGCPQDPSKIEPGVCGCGFADTDSDGDGYLACQECDDTDAGVNPGASESCGDGRDNDCDALTLDVFDADVDGWACTEDCDDGNSTVFPGAVDVCDGLDNDCDGTVDDDADGDGFGVCSDCDEGDAAVNPDETEVCGDGLDNDCDLNTVDLFNLDGDADTCDVDCDDTDPAINSSVDEVCDDTVDNDCDGLTDSADTECIPATLTVIEPQDGSVTSSAFISFEGSLSGGAGVEMNGGDIAAFVSGETFFGSFEAQEGLNELYTVLIDGDGDPVLGADGKPVVDVRSFTVDLTPPTLDVDLDDQLTFAASPVRVSGRVLDLAWRLVDVTTMRVTINGLEAETAFDSDFSVAWAGDIDLAPGENVVTVEATDAASNTTTRVFNWTLDANVPGPRVVVIDGDGQQGTVNTTLPSPLVVAVTDELGVLLVDRAVKFELVVGSGLLDGVRQVIQLTDVNGEARVSFTMGVQAGPGQRVRATTPGSDVAAEFVLDAGADVPAKVEFVHSPRSTEIAEEELALRVVLTDRFGNPAPGAAVTFEATVGGGILSQPTLTNAAGVASVEFTPAVGDNEIRAVHVASGAEDRLRLSGVAVDPGEPAGLAGRVINPLDRAPVPGATIAVVSFDVVATQTLSLADGTFSFTAVSPGRKQLIIDGSTSTDPDDAYGIVELPLNAIFGADSALREDVVLTPIDSSAQAVVDPAAPVEVEVNVPGVQLLVDGSTVAAFPETSFLAVSRGKAAQAPFTGSFRPEPTPPQFTEFRGSWSLHIVDIQASRVSDGVPIPAVFTPPASLTFSGLPTRAGSWQLVFTLDPNTGLSAVGSAAVQDSRIAIEVSRTGVYATFSIDDLDFDGTPDLVGKHGEPPVVALDMDGVPPFTGTFLPDGETGQLRVLGELEGNFILDLTSGDDGTIYGWDLGFLDVASDGLVTNTATLKQAFSLERNFQTSIVSLNQDAVTVIELTVEGPSNDANDNGLPDDYEASFGVTDPNADPDLDVWTVIEEFLRGTNPIVADTDDDGANDGEDADPLQHDQGPPVLSLLVPESWVEGSGQTVVVDVADDGKVVFVGLAAGGQSTTLTAPPYSLDFCVPTDETEVSVSAFALDTAGHSVSTSTLVFVDPDGEAPTVTFAPVGDPLTAGETTTLDFSLSDNGGLASLMIEDNAGSSFSFDIPDCPSTATTSLAYTVPTGVGQVTITATAVDSALNTGTASIVRTVQDATNPLVATNDAFTLPPLVESTVDLAANDNFTQGTFEFVISPPSVVPIVLEPNGTLRITPLSFIPGFTFTYRIVDGANASNQAVVALAFNSLLLINLEPRPDPENPGQSVVDVPVLDLDGTGTLHYPVYQFSLTNNVQDTCGEPHWHRSSGSVFPLETPVANGQVDPNPPGCGFNTLENLPPSTITWPADAYNDFLIAHPPI